MTDMSLLVYIALAWSSIGFLAALVLGRLLRYQSPAPDKDN